MKTFKLAFVVAISLLAFNSCEKSSNYSVGNGTKSNTPYSANTTDLTSASRIELLIAKRWKLTKIMSGNINIVQICELDNQDKYTQDGTLISTSNQLCPGEIQANYNKFWRLKDHTEFIEIAENNQFINSLSYTILKIDESNLLLKSPNGNTNIYTGIQ